MEKLLYFPGKYLVIHAIIPSKVHSPAKVLYLLRKGLWMIVLSLSVNRVIESMICLRGKITKKCGFYIGLALDLLRR